MNDEAAWHRCICFGRVRLIDGRVIWGFLARILERRRRNGQWEYRERPPTLDEWLDRQY